MNHRALTVLALLLVARRAAAQPFAYVVTNGPRIYAVDTRAFAIDPIEAGIETRDVAASPDGREVFVTGREGRVVGNLVADSGPEVIFVVDVATQRVGRTIPLAGADRIALAPDGRGAYVTGYDPARNTPILAVVETRTGAIRGTVPLGINPSGLAVTPDGGFVYLSTFGETPDRGTVWIIEAGSERVVKTLTVAGTPKAIAVSPQGDAVYVATYDWSGVEPGSIAVIDPATNTVTATVAVGYSPNGIAFVPNKPLALVTNGSYTASLLSTRHHTVACTLPLPLYMAPEDVAVHPDGTVAYVISESGLLVIDVAQNRLLRTVPVAGSGIAVGACPVEGCPPPAPTRTATITPTPTTTPSLENGCNTTCDNRLCLSTCRGVVVTGTCCSQATDRCECMVVECLSGCCELGSTYCSEDLPFNCENAGGRFFSQSVCNQATGSCESPPSSTPTPRITPGTPTPTSPRVPCAARSDCSGRPWCSAQGVCCDLPCDASHTSCDVGDYQSVCLAIDRPVGEVCCSDEQCRSGFCTDHVCCDTRCDGSQQACDLASREGSCVISPPTPTRTPFPICTPPPCQVGDVLHCEERCLGGCGVRCATPTASPPPSQTPTAIPSGCPSEITLHPNAGPAGSAGAFTGNCDVSPYGLSIGVLFDEIFVGGTTNLPGEYHVQFQVPASAAHGTHTVRVIANGKEIGTATFEVTRPGLTCIGDCDGNRVVTVAELITMVNVALGNRPIGACTGGDEDGSGVIEVTEVVQAVEHALAGCPLSGSPGSCHDGDECALDWICIEPGGFAGCGYCRTEMSECATDADCACRAEHAICVPAPASYCFCRSGVSVCVPGCVSSADCGVGEECNGTFRCVPRPCTANEDCPRHFACEATKEGARCYRRQCSADTECADGFCVKGGCFGELGTCQLLPA